MVVLLTAIAAKFVGCSFGAKLTGLTYRESAVVGVLVRVLTNPLKYSNIHIFSGAKLSCLGA